MRITEMITKDKMSWCLSNFSQLVPFETYGKHSEKNILTVLAVTGAERGKEGVELAVLLRFLGGTIGNMYVQDN